MKRFLLLIFTTLAFNFAFAQEHAAEVAEEGVSLSDMMYVLIGIAFVIIFVVGIRRYSARKHSSLHIVRTDARVIVEELEELGYFDYVEMHELRDLQKAMIEYINKYNYLSTLLVEDGDEPVDYRLYFCDGEELYEEGGFVRYLEIVQSAFDKRNLKLTWSNEQLKIREGNLEYHITVNNKEYIFTYDSKMRVNSWALAARDFYSMLQDQLTLQNSKEKLYAIAGADEGYFIFLTQQQFSYIQSINLDSDYVPKELKVWVKENEMEMV